MEDCEQMLQSIREYLPRDDDIVDEEMEEAEEEA